MIPGLLALGILCSLVGSALLALLLTTPAIDIVSLWQDAYLRRVVSFTFWQALLSTLLSVGFALPVARALARRQFAGHAWLIKLFGLPLVIPTIVAIFGIVAVYGQAGLINSLATTLGLPGGQYLYGLPGILIAHVFFNLPLAVRLLLPSWDAIPGESWRLANQLGMSSGAIFRLIEWPLLRQMLPGVAGLVFMLCFTSFAVVLTLGGGPSATTIEVAIYQALRFDFDLSRAVLLALLQLSVCALLIGVLQRFVRPTVHESSSGRYQLRPDLNSRLGFYGDVVIILLALLSVLLPLGAVVYAGLSGPLWQVLSDARLWSSALRSLLVAICASTLALATAWALLLSSRALRLRHASAKANLIELCGSLVLVVPPLVLGTGFFVLLAPVTDVFALALVLVIIVNALLALPYVIRILGPHIWRVAEQHERLCASLGIRGWHRLRWVEWPLLRRPLGLAAALSAALSTGDLGVIALFGTQDTATLPLLLYQRLASYQMEQAAVTALVLIMLCLGLFVFLERCIGGRVRVYA